MAKRKLGASVIILCIAAITLVSGTYAWFLVGGTAKLFDLGFGVIEGGAALELRGDVSEDPAAWKDELDRNDFSDWSFITAEGKYKPISSVDGTEFIYVGLDGHEFQVGDEPYGQQHQHISGNNNLACYNDFTFYVRSKGEDIVAHMDGNMPTDGAYLNIELGAYKEEDGKLTVDPTDDGASHAARVAVTISGVNDGKPVIYDIDGESEWRAVTGTFDNHTIYDADPYNQIIDPSETGSASILTAPVTFKKLVDDDKKPVKIYLGTIPPNTDSTGKMVHVQIWLEGNDKQCVDFGSERVDGKNLFSAISVHSGE